MAELRYLTQFEWKLCEKVSIKKGGKQVAA